MENSCRQFFDYYDLKSQGNGMESEIRPINLFDIDTLSKDLIITEIKKVPENNLLFLIVGFSYIYGKNIDKIEKILHDYENCIYMLGIEPDFNRIYDQQHNVARGTDLYKDAEKYVFGYFGEKFHDKIKDKKLITAPFPLTVYGPDPTKSDFISYVRMRNTELYLNNLEVLKEIINYNGDVLLLSNITCVCYRAFKYIIDIRTKLGKKTNIIMSHDETSNCDHDNPIFPNAYAACKDNMPFPEDNFRTPMQKEIYFTDIIVEKDQKLAEYTKENFGIESHGGYYEKYLKYKLKYLKLKNSLKGS